MELSRIYNKWVVAPLAAAMLLTSNGANGQENVAGDVEVQNGAFNQNANNAQGGSVKQTTYNSPGLAGSGLGQAPATGCQGAEGFDFALSFIGGIKYGENVTEVAGLAIEKGMSIRKLRELRDAEEGSEKRNRFEKIWDTLGEEDQPKAACLMGNIDEIEDLQTFQSEMARDERKFLLLMRFIEHAYSTKNHGNNEATIPEHVAAFFAIAKENPGLITSFGAAVQIMKKLEKEDCKVYGKVIATCVIEHAINANVADYLATFREDMGISTIKAAPASTPAPATN